MKRLLLAVVSLLFATSCTLVENILDKFGYEIIWPNKTEQSKQVSKPLPRAVYMVYSCAFEGHLNMRATPSFKAKIVGKFRNGPQGANLLQDLGGWSKIEYNGIEGYVVSRYLQRTPTIPYTGRVGVNWLEGVWMEDGCYEYCIYNNGYWEAGCDTFEKGYYIMQKNEVKLVVVRYMPDLTDGEWYTAKPNDHDSVRILKINERAGTLGGMAKKFEYGVGYVHPYMHNITDFRKHSQEIAKEVSAYMRK